ncbi:hypothetical protein GCM10018785_53750 [Streptomyces longispororuber]|uniref:Uncharacterized protein n=1 Tax=Streptomyces longispororuber TaxID=68230 RepID=A0A919A0F2_9ACTN|nr:hypothetical protein [Streptomyces longispororuber]GHE78842.1 hypothetical protein GCM10018785_53750 [Streptomyces longispororuber]
MLERKKIVTVLAATGLTLGLVSGLHATAQAAPSAAQTKNLAVFEGKKIDLSQNWGAAKACAVWRAMDGVSCFRTTAERDAHAAKLAARMSPAQAAATCTRPLHLYEHNGGRGRDLKFFDKGGAYQNLDRYNFNDQTSSYRTGSCKAHLAEHNGGRGYWYPGNTNANHYESAMRSGWNDRVSSILNY